MPERTDLNVAGAGSVLSVSVTTHLLRSPSPACLTGREQGLALGLTRLEFLSVEVPHSRSRTSPLDKKCPNSSFSTAGTAGVHLTSWYIWARGTSRCRKAQEHYLQSIENYLSVYKFSKMYITQTEHLVTEDPIFMIKLSSTTRMSPAFY